MSTNVHYYALKRRVSRAFREGTTRRGVQKQWADRCRGRRLSVWQRGRSALHSTLRRASLGLCYQSPLLILERLSLALPSGSAEAQVVAAQIRDGSGAHQLHIPY